MKLKKFLFLGGFVLAFGASFAFTSKQAINISAWYYSGDDNGNPMQCVSGETDNAEDSVCGPDYTGIACTILDTVSGEERQAYAMRHGVFSCAIPLYQPAD